MDLFYYCCTSCGRIHTTAGQAFSAVVTWVRGILLDNLMADLLADENNLKYIVSQQHYIIQAVIPLRNFFLFSGKKNPPLKMNECNFLHHYKCTGCNLYFQFNFIKSQNIYLNFNISQKYPSFLTFFWKVGLGLGCIWQQFCQSDPEYIYASLAMLSLYAQVPGVGIQITELPCLLFYTKKLVKKIYIII